MSSHTPTVLSNRLTDGYEFIGLTSDIAELKPYPNSRLEELSTTREISSRWSPDRHCNPLDTDYMPGVSIKYGVLSLVYRD
jgi:hypothetical protein